MASVNQAEAAFEQARRTVDRLRPLHEKGAISDQDFDNALTALRVAEANLEAAQRSVVLTSPVAGVVTDVPATVGSFPAPGDPLVHVSDLSRVQVILQVSSGQRQELALGQRVVLPGAHEDSPASAEAGRPWTGEVTRIAMQADHGVRTDVDELQRTGVHRADEVVRPYRRRR
ncbi:MAG: efflux RND transporter periplasmic adaptor subunit, partial [Longimicrobiales bacterium]